MKIKVFHRLHPRPDGYCKWIEVLVPEIERLLSLAEAERRTGENAEK